MSQTMMVVTWAALWLLMAGLAVRAGWRVGADEGELAQLLRWWSLAAFFLVLVSMAVVSTWPAAVAVAVGLLVLCVFAGRAVQTRDRAAEDRLVASAGGPVRARRLPAWISAMAAATITLAIAAAAYAVLRAWWASLSRVGGQITTDLAAAQQVGQEMQTLGMATMTVAAGGWLLALAVALVVWLGQRSRCNAAQAAYEDECATWWDGLTVNERRRLGAAAERCQLAWQIGLTARSTGLRA